MSGVTVHRCSRPAAPGERLPNEMIWFITLRAMLTGIANPIPMLPPLPENMAVLMPTNSPLRLIRAPPEFPGLMEASVWMKSS